MYSDADIYTYYVVTKDSNLLVRYYENEIPHDTFIHNTEWHLSFVLDPATEFARCEIVSANDVLLTYYFARKGSIIEMTGDRTDRFLPAYTVLVIHHSDLN
jgi:hypothetical protein